MIQTASLTATYAGPHVPDNPWWVRLEQIPVTNDVATVGETATLLDALYQMDPCTVVETTDEDAELTTEDVAAAASETLTLAACDIDADGSCEVQIKVIRSHQTEPYRLHVAGGSVVETVVVHEEVRQNLPVSGSTEITLEYPVTGAFAASWQSDLITASGSKPAIKRNGNVLYWDESATGTLRAAYLTVYDLVTIKVDGVDGELGEALIRVVFHGLAEELTPVLPEPAEMDRSLCGGSSRLIIEKDRVTCYKAITVDQVCSCSKSVVGSSSHNQVVPCPGWVTRCPGTSADCMTLLGSETVQEYVECEGDSQVSGTSRVWKVSDPDYYKKICCVDPSNKLPQCYEKTTSYRGGKDIAGGRQSWVDLYGPATRFVPVSPAGGVCGQHIIRQVVTELNCCEHVELLEWDKSASATVIADFGRVAVKGGAAPFTWTLTGEHFSFNPGSVQQTITTDGNSVVVYLDDFACGYCAIACVDFCEQTATGGVKSTEGRWRDATTEELLELPTNTMYEPEEILGIPVKSPVPGPAPDTLPPELEYNPTGDWAPSGVAMVEKDGYRFYTWFAHMVETDDSIEEVDYWFEVYSYDSTTPKHSVMPIGDAIVNVDYVNIYSDIIILPIQNTLNDMVASSPLVEAGFTPIWVRSTEKWHTWYATIPHLDGSTHYSGIRCMTGCAEMCPYPRVYTWSCE